MFRETYCSKSDRRHLSHDEWYLPPSVYSLHRVRDARDQAFGALSCLDLRAVSLQRIPFSTDPPSIQFLSCELPSLPATTPRNGLWERVKQAALHSISPHQEDHEENHLQECASDVANHKATHKAREVLGKKAATASDWMLTALTHGAPPESRNPLRDGVIATTVHSASYATLLLHYPTTPFPYLFLVSEGAGALSNEIRQIDIPKGDFAANVSKIYTIMLLQLAALPGQAFHKATHFATLQVMEGFDALEALTQRGVERLGQFYRQPLPLSAPEQTIPDFDQYIETTWLNAIEEHKRRRRNTP